MTNTARKLLLGMLGGGSDPSASFTVTTTGAATLSFNMEFSATTTVDWGDGSSDNYTGVLSSRTHNYAGAGTWRVRILQPLNVTRWQLALDAKFTSDVGPAVLRMANLTLLQLAWSGTLSPVTFSSPLPAGLTDMRIYDLSVAWTINGSTPMPTGLTRLDLRVSSTQYVSSFEKCLTLNGTIALTGSAFPSAQVDAILLDLYTAAQSRTSASAWSLNISGGTNGAPSGTYEATCPPTTGKSAAYELINDSCGVIAAGKEMASITVTGGLP
jgi:hypothetical protein